jgi:hypothetical protein
MGRSIDQEKGFRIITNSDNGNQPVTLDKLAEVEVDILKHLEKLEKSLIEKVEGIEKTKEN